MNTCQPSSNNTLSEEKQLKVAEVAPDSEQPRKYFDPFALKRLADSIATDGQKLPIVVRTSGRTDPPWIIVDGERRWRACRLIRRSHVRAFVSRVSDPAEVFTDQVIANFFREGHTPFETARAVFRMKDEMGMSVAQIARVVGKSEPWVYQHLQLLKLAPEVSELMEPDRDKAQRLKFQIALLLTSLPHDVQTEIATAVCGKGMTLKKARRIVEIRAGQAGHQVGGETARRPSSQWSRLDKFISATAEQMELWGEREDQLPGICANRETVEIEIASDFLLQFSEDARSLRDVLRGILKTRKKATD